MPTILNAANEVAVDSFIKGQITFIQIPLIIERTLEAHSSKTNPSLDEIQEADVLARYYAKSHIENLQLSLSKP
jgi:1-deoxy-D-xylulose-5-phosphate reductoisomerase